MVFHRLNLKPKGTDSDMDFSPGPGLDWSKMAALCSGEVLGLVAGGSCRIEVRSNLRACDASIVASNQVPVRRKQEVELVGFSCKILLV